MRFEVFLLIVVLVSSSVIAVVVDGKTLPVPDEGSLQCRQFDNTQQRLLCRVNVGVPDTLTYLPERCRTLSMDARNDCLAVEAAAQPCRVYNDTVGREECLREVFGLDSFQAKYGRCMQVQGSERRTCQQVLSVHIMRMASFRLDELTDKAIRAVGRGVLPAKAAGIVQRIEQARTDLVIAQTNDARVTALKNMQRDWRLWVSQVQGEIE